MQYILSRVIASRYMHQCSGISEMELERHITQVNSTAARLRLALILPSSLLVIGQVIEALIHTTNTQQGHSIQIGKYIHQHF